MSRKLIQREAAFAQSAKTRTDYHIKCSPVALGVKPPSDVNKQLQKQFVNAAVGLGAS